MNSNNTIQKLEKELLDMQAEEAKLEETKPKPSGFAKALEQKNNLIKKVENF
jgi:hypothetical protein